MVTVSETVSETDPTFPSVICVSELLRTWETAILLFLNNKNTKLTLFISPFLREDGKLPSDQPGILQDQLYEFMRFLVFLGQLKKFTKADESEDIKNLFSEIPNEFTITFKHYAGIFTEEIMKRIRRTQLLTLKINDDALEISCPDISKITLDKFVTDGMLQFLQQLYDKILDFNGLKDVNDKKVEVVVRGPNFGSGKYTEYIGNGNASLVYPEPENIPEFDKNDLNKISSPPSIRTFAEWSTNNIQRIRDPKTSIIYFVSHSHIMQAFVKEVIKINKEQQPSDSFRQVYDVAKKTNSWSLFFKVNEVDFKGFRHAFSCDNRYQAKGLGFMFLTLRRRWKAGSYTNLALWGILSTTIFATKKLQGLIRDNLPGSLKVSVGMNKEPKDLVVDRYDKYNMLCGDIDDRFKTGNFEITLSNCGTSSKLTLTLDNDCIKIKYRKDNGTFNPQKVVLRLSKDDPPNIQAKYFKDDSNTYTSPPIKGEPTSLLNIASYLSGINIPPTNNDEILGELEGLTLEMTEAISNFIKSDVFKKIKNKATWDKSFGDMSKNVHGIIQTEDVEFSGGRGCGLVRRSTKKMRKYKKYTKKYYRCQSRRKSRRVRKHRRKSRK
jgi:hypothetical protein